MRGEKKKHACQNDVLSRKLANQGNPTQILQKQN
jgi:hypothetical protein